MGTALRPPRWIKPQLTRLVAKAPTSGGWLHEIKYDGYRMHARLDGGQIKLLTRSGLDWSHRYRRTVEALGSPKVKSAYLDGELCRRRSGLGQVHGSDLFDRRDVCLRGKCRESIRLTFQDDYYRPHPIITAYHGGSGEAVRTAADFSVGLLIVSEGDDESKSNCKTAPMHKQAKAKAPHQDHRVVCTRRPWTFRGGVIARV